MKKRQDTVLRVDGEMELLAFLLSKMGGMTKTSVKQLLGQRRVQVNTVVQTRHDVVVHAGDAVTVTSGRGNGELHHPKLRIDRKSVV